MIGNRLKRAREAVGLSLRDLEGAIHGQVSAQAIGKYERGEMMPGSTVLLALSLLVATISLSTGRTTVLQGAVHLVIFAVYLVTTVIP